ncbi:hypothetical protein [Nocardioides aurantiacus]|uniref:Uncharacterized protein n=1 Tax=Nocardioides aurantiacus TaxID=86796 RepID=A0A3N2CU14_9ACTN|nr:hypothetical protein [Nocardioides aurantiacus]ROR91017.1 hypothetical protein EDD33_1877 [Nocardioides aurantiacus]
MDSRRNVTPMGVQDEIDELFASAVEEAVHFLASSGEFHPMGFYTGHVRFPVLRHGRHLGTDQRAFEV